MIRYLLFFLFGFSFVLNAQVKVPDQGGYWVHDEANVLSPAVRNQLEYIIKAERDSTSNQIGVLIVPSLNGEVLEDYTLKVATDWKIGTKKNDNGVLLFIAIQDKKVRIEVGEGNEGALTDLIANRIIRNEIAPHFRQGDVDGGVTAAVTSIIQAIKGQYVNTDPPQAQRRRGGRSPWLTLIILAVIIIAASRRKGGGGGVGGYWAAGSILGGMGGGGGYGGGGGGSYGGGGSFGGGGSSGSW